MARGDKGDVSALVAGLVAECVLNGSGKFPLQCLVWFGGLDSVKSEWQDMGSN